MLVSKDNNRQKIPLIFCIFISLIFSSCAQEPSAEETEIINVVEKFFGAMAAHDKEAAVSVLIPQGQFFSIREDSSGAVWRNSSHQDFLEQIATSEQNWLERMWEPKILIHDRIAVLWANYDFYRDKKFSHCGVDAFSLLKTTEGWKIAGIIYTIEPDGKEESPLGAPVF